MLCLRVQGKTWEQREEEGRNGSMHGEDDATHATLQYVQCVFGDVCMRCGDDCSGMHVMPLHVMSLHV